MHSTSVKVYIPEGGTLMVVRRGGPELLSKEDLAAGYVDSVNIMCNLFYCTESDEYLTKTLMLTEPFDSVYPEGSEARLAKDAVEAFQGNVKFEILE